MRFTKPIDGDLYGYWSGSSTCTFQVPPAKGVSSGPLKRTKNSDLCYEAGGISNLDVRRQWAGWTNTTDRQHGTQPDDPQRRSTGLLTVVIDESHLIVTHQPVINTGQLSILNSHSSLQRPHHAANASWRRNHRIGENLQPTPHYNVSTHGNPQTTASPVALIRS